MHRTKNLLQVFNLNIIFKIFRNLTLYFISLLIPKSKKIVLVGGWFGERFSDNSKYTFLYLSKYKEELNLNKVIYVTRSNSLQRELTQQGLFSLNLWSIKSIWYHLRAYFHIVDQSHRDINSIFSIRSKRIHLWHGFPLKRVGEIGKYLVNGVYSEDVIPSKESKILEKTKIISSNGFWEDFYMLGTSELSKNIMSKAFRVPSTKMFISGYPRNFNFYEEKSIKFYTKDEKEVFDKIYSYSKSNKLILGYFPTFRDRTKTNLFGVDDKSQIRDFLDLCESVGIKVITKFHSADKTSLDEIVSHTAITNLPSYFDIYNFLECIDIVISDYSSIAFDFLLLDKPVVFFPYDLRYYSNKDRKLIFSYDEFSPGPTIYTIDELKSLIPNLKDNFKNLYMSQYGEEAKKLRTKILKMLNYQTQKLHR